MPDLADLWPSVAGSMAKSDRIYGKIKLQAWPWPWWPYRILRPCLEDPVLDGLFQINIVDSQCLMKRAASSTNTDIPDTDTDQDEDQALFSQQCIMTEQIQFGESLQMVSSYILIANLSLIP